MNDTQTRTQTRNPLDGLAFPVVKVRYAGPTNTRGSRYIATLRNTRIVRPYDHALSGSENAYRAAVACWARYEILERMTPYDETTQVLIPGDLSDDTYAFTVVPAGFLTLNDS